MKLFLRSYFHRSLLLLLALVIFQCSHSKKVSSNSNLTAQAIDSTKFTYYFIEGCNERMKGNLEIAEKHFYTCLKINPKDPAVKYELANIKKVNNEKELALKYSKECALADEKNEWYQLLYIDCLHAMNQFEQAAHVYSKLQKQNPYRVDFYEGMANEYMYAHNYDKALHAYEDMISKFGSNETFTLNKIKLLKALHKKTEAESEFQILIQLHPKEVKYYTYLAEFFQENNENEKAWNIYKDVLKIDSLNPMIHLAIADYYKNKNDKQNFFKEIKIAFESPDLAIETKQKILASYYQLTEENQSYKQEADELCSIMLRLHPNAQEAHTIYADFLYRDKKIKEAKDEYEKAVGLDKSKFINWNQLMYLEAELNENIQLDKHSSEAMELFPTQSTPYFFNGIANIQLKNYEKAASSFSEGIEFVYNDNPLLTQFYYNLGDAYHYLKSYEQSDKAFESALKIEDNNSYVLNNYAYYLSLRKSNLDKAEKLSRRSNEIEPNNRSYIDTYGWILFQLEKYIEAEIWLGKASKMGAKNPVILEHYGDVLFKLNKVEDAVYIWNEAKKAGSGSIQLEKKIAEKRWYE